ARAHRSPPSRARWASCCTRRRRGAHRGRRGATVASWFSPGGRGGRREQPVPDDEGELVGRERGLGLALDVLGAQRERVAADDEQRREVELAGSVALADERLGVARGRQRLVVEEADGGERLVVYGDRAHHLAARRAAQQLELLLVTRAGGGGLGARGGADVEERQRDPDAEQRHVLAAVEGPAAAQRHV